MFNVIIDGTDMATYNICAKERPKIPTPKRQYIKQENVYSYTGTNYSNAGWQDMEIEIDFNYLEPIQDDQITFRRAFFQIRAALLNAKRLQFSDDLEVYYKVKGVEIGDAANDIAEYGEFTATFTCAPFGQFENERLVFQHNKQVSNGVTYFDRQTILNDGITASFPTIRIEPRNTTNINAVSLEILDEEEKTLWTMSLQNFPNDPTKVLVIDPEKSLVYIEYQFGSQTRVEEAWKVANMYAFPYLMQGANSLIVRWLNGTGATATLSFDVVVDRRRVI